MSVAKVSPNSSVHALQIPSIAKAATLSNEEIYLRSYAEAEKKGQKYKKAQKILLPVTALALTTIAAVKKPAALSGKIGEALSLSGGFAVAALGALTSIGVAAGLISKTSDETKEKISQHPFLTTAALFAAGYAGMRGSLSLANKGLGYIAKGFNNSINKENPSKIVKFISDIPNKIDGSNIAKKADALRDKYSTWASGLTGKKLAAKNFVSDYSSLAIALGALGTSIGLGAKTTTVKNETMLNTQDKLFTARDDAQCIAAKILTGDIDVNDDI